MTRGVIAGWVAAHRGAAALAGGVLATLITATLGATPIDLFGDAQPPPLWAMYPGMIALIATVAGQNRLIGLTTGTPRSFVGPRGVWLGTVAAVSCGLALVVQAALDQRAIWVLCLTLSVVVLGLGALWRPLGLIVAALVEIWAVTAARSVFVTPDPAQTLLRDLGPAGHLIWWAGVGIAAVNYVAWGE